MEGAVGTEGKSLSLKIPRPKICGFSRSRMFPNNRIKRHPAEPPKDYPDSELYNQRYPVAGSSASFKPAIEEKLPDVSMETGYPAATVVLSPPVVQEPDIEMTDINSNEILPAIYNHQDVNSTLTKNLEVQYIEKELKKCDISTNEARQS